MAGVWLFLCDFGFGYSSFVLVLRVVGFWWLFCVRMYWWVCDCGGFPCGVSLGFGAVGLGFLLVWFCLADFSGFLRGWCNIRFRVFCSDGVLLLGFVLVGFGARWGWWVGCWVAVWG